MTGWRIRPASAAVTVAVGVLWALSFGAVRDFVWADLREGMLTTAGLSRATRATVWLGFVLVFALVGGLLFNDLWRSELALLPIHNSTGLGLAGRGGQIPYLLLPATLFLFAVGWTFLLVGALHCHVGIRLVALGLYLEAAANWAFTGQSSLNPSWPALAAGAVGIVAVPVIFAARWRSQPRPVPELLALLIAVTLAYAPGHAQSVAALRLSGAPSAIVQLQTSVVRYETFVLPMLILLGMDIADFTRRAAGWTVTIVIERLPGRMPYVLLAIVLGWRLVAMARDVAANLRNDPPDSGSLAYAGALVEVVAVLIVGAAVLRVQRGIGAGRPPSADEIATAVNRHVLPLILAFSLVPLVVVGFTIVYVLFILVSLTRLAQLPDSTYEGVFQATVWLGRALPRLTSDETFLVWHNLLATLAILSAFWLARRGRSALALYLGIFGVLHILWRLTRPGRPLAALHWKGWEVVDAWWVVLLALVGAFWLARGTLTPERAARLLFLVLITFLLRQTAFIESPFSPFLAFAGVGFLAFGIVWDALTRGSWANADSPALPRVGRIFLYLGYTLLTATLVNFVLASHLLGDLELFTGRGARVGLDSIGRPFLYALFVVTLALPARASPDLPEPYRSPG